MGDWLWYTCRCDLFFHYRTYILSDFCSVLKLHYSDKVFYIKMIRLLTYFKGLTNGICSRIPAFVYGQDNISFYRFPKSIPLERTNIRKAELNRNSGTRMKERILNRFTIPFDWFRFMVFNDTFNNITVISWRSILLLEETGVSGENHRPVASHWQTLSHNVGSSTRRLCGVRTLNVSGDRH